MDFPHFRPACYHSPVKIASRSWAPAASAALLASALYAITLGGTYIYDDAYIVGEDPRVRQPRLWGQFWTHDWFNGGLDNLYRPLVSQSFGIQMWLHGDRRWAFHLVNILLHAGVCAGRGTGAANGGLAGRDICRTAFRLPSDP